MVRGGDGVWRELPGYQALWGWFGLSRASWLTLPRVLMHEMPDDWQASMAELLHEYDQTYRNLPGHSVVVQVKKDGKFTAMPDWVAYRYPDMEAIESFKAKQ